MTVIRGDFFEQAGSFEPGQFPLIIADPPYGGIVHEKWDEVTCYDELAKAIERLLPDGGTAYVWGGIGKPGNRPFFKWLSEVESKTGLTLHNLITWSKKRAYGTQFNYLFTREECAMLVKGDRPRTFNVPLLEELRGYAGYDPKYPAKSEFKRRTNVWTDITELFRGKIHIAEKPSKLAEIMISVSSQPGESVLDPFAGSGSTGVAAEKLGRPYVLVEKSDCKMRL